MLGRPATRLLVHRAMAGCIALATACTTTPMPSPSATSGASTAVEPSATSSQDAVPGWRAISVDGDADADVELTDVAIGDDGRAVAFGSAGGVVAIATTADGAAWSLDSDDSSFDFAQPVAVVEIHGRFVIVGTQDGSLPVAWSGDGVGPWQPVDLPGAPTQAGVVTDVARIGDRLVAVGEAAWYSDDAGDSWSLGDARPDSTRDLPGGGDVGCLASLTTVDVVGGRLLAFVPPFCGGGEVWHSDDGAHWTGTAAEMTANSSFIGALDAGDDVLVHGTRGVLATAWRFDGSELVELDAFRPIDAHTISDVVATGDGYLAVIDDGLWRSDDGLDWSPIPLPPDGARVLGLAVNAGTAIAVGTDAEGRPAIWTNPARGDARLAVQPVPTPRDLAGTWERRASTPVRGATAATLSLDGDGVLAFGAVDPDTGPIVQAYDIRTDTWSARRLGTPRDTTPAAAARHDGVIVVAVQANLDAQLTAFDAAAIRLTSVGPPVEGAYAVGLFEVGDELVMAIYDQATASGALLALDDETLAWTRLTDAPGPFEEVAAANGAAVVGYIRGRLWRYDLAADAWRPEQRSPILRGQGAMATDRTGTTWLIGGFTEGSPDGTVQAYDPQAGAWLIGPDLPTPRYDPAVVVLEDGDLLAIGGWTDGGSSAAVEQLRR